MFDGPMLAASVVRALAAIPGAIRNVLDMLKSGRPDAQSAIDELTGLRGHFVDMCAVEASLKEAKEIHDLLHRLERELESIGALYRKAIAHGQFQGQAYTVAEVQLQWYGIKQRALIELLTKATLLKHVNLVPLVLDNDGEAVSGPDWALRFVSFRKSIDQMLSKYDEGKSFKVRDLANLMNHLIEHVKSVMFQVNQRILNEAAELGEAMRECRAAMSQV